MAFEQTFRLLNDMGLFDILLPFVLVFTVVFAILQKVRIFDDKRVNTMIALVMGLATISPHVLWGTREPYDAVLVNGMPDVVEIINNAIPSVSLVVVAILMALIIVGILGRKVELGNTSLSGWIALLSFVVVAFIFLAAAGVFQNRWTLYFDANPDLVALIIVILVFAIIVWFVTKDDGDETRMSKETIGDKLSETLLSK